MSIYEDMLAELQEAEVYANACKSFLHYARRCDGYEAAAAWLKEWIMMRRAEIDDLKRDEKLKSKARSERLKAAHALRKAKKEAAKIEEA